MENHFRMCASAYRDGATIDVTAYAGLPDQWHEGKITAVGDDPDVLKIFIEFTRHDGSRPDGMIWTWEEHCVLPYRGQQRVELIGVFEEKAFRQMATIADSKPNYVVCPFIVIAKNVAHEPRLGCRSVLAGTDDFPKDYEQVYPDRETQPDSRASKADCEEWRRENCA
jgi:hypothetical protein